MKNFDLTKYLSNNPLLNEGLSNQEQDIIDDILSVNEDLESIKDKLKDYAKKGLITVSIMTSVCGTVSCDSEMMNIAKPSIEMQMETKSQEMEDLSKQAAEITKKQSQAFSKYTSRAFKYGPIDPDVIKLSKESDRLSDLRSELLDQLLQLSAEYTALYDQANP